MVGLKDVGARQTGESDQSQGQLKKPMASTAYVRVQCEIEFLHTNFCKSNVFVP